MTQKRRLFILLSLIIVLTTALQSCALKTVPNESPEIKQAGSKKYPIPMQTAVFFNGLSTKSDPYVLELTLTDVLRGEKALPMVKGFNSTNSDPPGGMEYLVARVHAKAFASKGDAMIDLHSACFSLIGQDGTAYDEQVSIAGLTPRLGGMYQGAERDGYVYFLVDQKENYPYVVFLPGVNGGLWFATDPKATLSKDIRIQIPSLEGVDTNGNAVKGSRSLPYSPKDKAVFDYLSVGGGGYSATVMLNIVKRGKSALEQVDKADKFHPDVPKGKEYLLASFTITLKNRAEEEPMDFNQSDFALVSEDGNMYNDFVYIDEYENDFKSMNKGEARTGYIYFLIDAADKTPNIVFLPKYNGGLWFSTK